MTKNVARLGLIWAEARNGAIGRNGEMPWHLPEDLAHFKKTTFGAPVIMGRRTWESLPEKVRPLPGRTNIVVTRDASYRAEGATVCSSLDEAYALLAGKRSDTAWVMGGGELYRQALPKADELVITRLDLEVPDADTFAPVLGDEWERVESSDTLQSVGGISYRIERFLRSGQIA